MVRLEFRRNSADCPPPKHFDVRLETESSAAAALYQWAADVCSAKPPFSLDVTNTSSEAARQQFFLKQVDIGVSSLPPQPGEVPQSAPRLRSRPIDLTALVFAYNIVDPVTGQQITDLKLSPRFVARLLSDSEVIGFFNDPEFKHSIPDTPSRSRLPTLCCAPSGTPTHGSSPIGCNANHSARTFSTVPIRSASR